MKQLFTFPTSELQQDTVYVTLAMELHATTLTNDKDRIQFENLVSEAKKKLQDSDLPEKTKLLEQLNVVMNNIDQFIRFIGGLTIYITPDEIYFYHLAIAVADNVYIGELPYIMPVIYNFQFTRNYHLLVLNRDNIRFFEGFSNRLEELPIEEMEDAPIDLTTALGSDFDDSSLNYRSHRGQGFGSNSGGQEGTGYATHGHRDLSEEKDIDRDRYFNMVDKFVYDNFSNKQKLPLIVFSVEDNQAVFREISNNEYLVDTGINGSAANMKNNEIEKRAAQTIDEIIAHQRNELFEELKETSPDNRIENIPDDLASASLQGRIEKLYVTKGFEIPGTITEEGLYDSNSEKNDFVQRIVHNVIQTNGEVYVLLENESLENTPIAARLRY